MLTHKKTPGQRRAAYMRTIRRADYEQAKTAEPAVVKDYENRVNERTSRPVMTPIATGSGKVVVLPYHYKK